MLGGIGKALGEIYKIYMLLHRSDLNISAYTSRFFFEKFIISADFANFLLNLYGILSDFSGKVALTETG